MLAPDVNILIYAHRQDDAAHEKWRTWVEELVVGPQPFALSSLVAAAFLRIVTNRRVYPTPTPMAAALAVIDGLVAQPNCRVIGPGARHWEILADLCRKTGVAGPVVADAQHAAVAIENGCEWVTCDGDFQAFVPAGLRLRQLRR